MPEMGRLQVVGYVIGAIVIAALGVRYMHNQAAASSASPGSSGSRSFVTTAGSSPGGGSSAASGRGTAAPDVPSVRIEASGTADALVHVAGAVRHPGVYKLTAGARVKDAVARAGGGAQGSDVNAINLAAKVSDGQQIVVPRRAPVGVATAGGSPGHSGGAAVSGTTAGGPPAAPVNLNTATLEELETLDGVGPATAQKILDWRQQNGGFRSVDDLGQVPGIGPKKLAALHDKVQA